MTEHEKYLAEALHLASVLGGRHGEYVKGVQVTPTDHAAIDAAVFIHELVEEIRRLTAVKLRAKLLITFLERSINGGPLSCFPIPERELLVALRDAVVAAEDWTKPLPENEGNSADPLAKEIAP